MLPNQTIELQKHLANIGKIRLTDRSKVPFQDGWHAFISLTNETIKAGSFQQLLGVWNKYQREKRLNLNDPDTYLEHAICAALQRERGSSKGWCSAPAMSSPETYQIGLYRNDGRVPNWIQRGKRGQDGFAWAALALACLDNRLTPAYVSAFTRGIGCGSCVSHFKQLLKKFPPDYSSPEAAFRWQWNVHNEVNKRIGKPVITYEQAWKIWNTQYK